MKHVVVVQNVDLSEDLAVSVFLKNMLQVFSTYKDLNVEAITARQKGKFSIKNVEIHPTNAGLYSIKDNLKFSTQVYKKLKKINKKEKVDTVDCFYPNSSLMGAVLFKLLINRKVRLVYQVRSPWIEMAMFRGVVKKSGLFKKLAYFSEYVLSYFVDHYIFITEGLKDYYKGKIRLKNNYSIIPSGVNTELFYPRDGSKIRKKYGIRKNDVLLGMVGNLARVREYDKVIKMFAELVRKNNKYKLMVVGDGENKNELVNLSGELGIKDSVAFTGNIKHKKVPEYISAFNIGICHIPNIFVYQNSFPLKVLEYSACGIPILASDIKAHREIKKLLEGIFIYNNSLEGVVKKIKLTNKSLSFLKLNELFCWREISNSIVEVY